MSHLPQPRYTPEEYLVLERAAEHRSEYLNGVIIPRVPSNLSHNQIVSNITGELGMQLKRRLCSVFSTNMRVKVQATSMYCYPDIMGFCGEASLEDAHQDTLLNPSLLMEIISPATEAFDRGEKFRHYRRLESLQEYVMISQDKVMVEHYLRQHEAWVLTEFRDLQERMKLESIGCTLELCEVYYRVEFPDAAARANEAGR